MPRPLLRLLLFLGLATTRMASPSVEAHNALAATRVQSSDLAGRLAEIEQQVEAKRRELAIPGVALAIVKDDRVIFQKGFGLRDVERNLPVTADTLFAIGSSTKSFTAMAAVISQDLGTLSLDDSPKTHLSYFRLQDPEADAMITVRDLLLHRSGLNVGDFVWQGLPLKRNDVIKLAGLATPTAKLREKFQYQNITYTAAGEVVAKANGTTWEKFVEERIFRPLGMKSSHTSLRSMTKVKDHATGYVVADKSATKAVLLETSTVAPAGAIASNVKDMSQWIRLILGEGVLDGKRFVSESGFNDIVKRHIAVDDDLGVPPYLPSAGYGLGWFLADRNGHHVVYHPGGINGFTALVQLVPDQKLGLVVLVNASSNAAVATISNVVFDNIVGQPRAMAATAESAPRREPSGHQATVNAGVSAASDITIDQLMEKVIAAAGGEANLRRHRSTAGTGILHFENQGVTGRLAVYAQAPNSATQSTTFIALGRKIGSMREYFDGKQGGFEGIFGTEQYTDEQLPSVRISSDYYELLNWRTLYKTLTIGKSKAADEEVYVVVKTPATGDAIVDYISASTFLLVKRASNGQETIYSDYRNVDGEMVAFAFVSQGGGMGRIAGRVQEVKFNTSIPPSTFRPSTR